MKKLLYFLSICSIVLAYSCKDDDEFNFTTVKVQLSYPGETETTEGVKVMLTSGTGEEYQVNTNATGNATFQVPQGIYEATVTEDRVVDEVYAYQYTGTKSNITVSETELAVTLELTESYLGRTDSKIEVSFQLVYPSGSSYDVIEGITVLLSNSQETLVAQTTAEGLADFIVSPGTYQASVSDKRAGDGYVYTYSTTKDGIVLSESASTSTTVNLELTETISGQIIIKELYISGCPNDDGSGYYSNDQYVILYNNSDQTASLDNICLGSLSPYNSNSTSKYLVDGVLNYLNEGWVPATNAIPFTQSAVSLEPGEEMVIALCGAIDHTLTYSKSVNLANSEYWVLYDYGVQLTHSKYVAPDASIPTSQYLGIQRWGLGNAWVFSNSSPAFFICTTKGSTPEAYSSSTVNYTDEEGTWTKKMNTEWILDGVEVFRAGYENSKRFPDGVDAGNVSLTGRLGYTVYRNVDKAATEAIAENADKLVYNYAYGTEVDGVSSTDPSGIDAEASIANGARIVFMDTNNSSNDFHQRSQASLRD
ncbi:MAG: DUF4876 domain-containing protein [Draconibacterium sp.]